MAFRVIQELVREQRQEEARVEGFRGLGFRVLGIRVGGFWGLGFTAPQLGEKRAVLAICYYPVFA